MRFLMSLTTFAACVAVSSTANAEPPVIFVSSFAPGENGAIHAMEFDTTSGTLRPLAKTTDVEHPFFLAVSPDGHFLYAVDAEKFGGDDDEYVTAFEVAGRTGQLKRLNRVSARGTATCYLDIDATGRTVVLANYSSGNIAALPVDKDGSLGEAASFIQHAGSSVNAARQKGPYAHSIEISPDNRFALAADLGIDKILIYGLDAETASLSPNKAMPSADVPPGSGPRHLTFHPNGKFVYVINELTNTVTAFDWTAESGKLTRKQTISTLPEDFDGTSYCADLKITPDGRFLYGTNRGHDSLAAYRIAEDGSLTLISIEPSGGKGPQNLFIPPDGGWLLCANMPGENLAVFRIDDESGSLTMSGTPLSIPMPSCIRLLP